VGWDSNHPGIVGVAGNNNERLLNHSVLKCYSDVDGLPRRFPTY